MLFRNMCHLYVLLNSVLTVSKECNSWSVAETASLRSVVVCLSYDRQHSPSSVVISVHPAGCGASESTHAAHQTAEGSAEETSAERRSQLGDKIQEREPEHNQV